MILRNHAKYIAIFAIPFLFSMIFRYSYVDFPSNGSIPVGQMLTAESIVREGNYNVSEYYGAAGADVFKYKGEWYVPHSPLNSLSSAIPLFFSTGYIKIFDLRIDTNTELVNNLNSFTAGILQSTALGGIALVLFLIYTKTYKVGNKLFLYSLPLFITLSTILVNYSVSYTNHILVALFVLLSWYLFCIKKYSWAGIIIGISFIGEYHTIFLYGFYLIWMFASKERIVNYIKLLIPGIVCLLFILTFNTIVFDGPLNFGQLIYEKYSLLEHKSTFGSNPLRGIYIGLFSPLKGIIWYVPIIILSTFFLLKYHSSYKKELIIIGGYSAFTIIFYSLWDNCWGDSPLGPRHLISIIPLMAIPLSYPFANGNKPRYKNIYLLTLFIWGILYFTFSLLNVLNGLPRKEFVECKLSAPAYYQKAREATKYKNKRCAPIVMNYFCRD